MVPMEVVSGKRATVLLGREVSGRAKNAPLEHLIAEKWRGRTYSPRGAWIESGTRLMSCIPASVAPPTRARGLGRLQSSPATTR
jgi:hypothetical protein